MSGSTDKWHAVGDGRDNVVVVVVVCGDDADGDVGEVIEMGDTECVVFKSNIKCDKLFLKCNNLFQNLNKFFSHILELLYFSLKSR